VGAKDGEFSALADFCRVSAEESLAKCVFRLPGRRQFSILLQRGIAVSDREAAALPGRFLPELGRSLKRAANFFVPGSSARVLCACSGREKERA
jgi:hypothetical protein